MRVLAFDTTVGACSVALWDDGETAAAFHEPMVHGQAEALVPAIEQTLKDAGMKYSDIDRIAVTIGPGSFTGVRVGLATARGIAVAADLPVIGVLTTEAMAADAQTDSAAAIAVAIDARRAEVYLQCFAADGTAVADPACLLPEDAARILRDQPWRLVGDGASRVKAHAGPNITCGPPTDVNAVVLARLAAAKPVPGFPPGPVYVRPPDAVVPKHGGRLRQ